jgi:MFS family permease
MQSPISTVALAGLTSQGRDEETQTQESLSPNLRPTTRNGQALVLLSSFLTICITIGLNQSYGVFQAYYTSPTQTFLPSSTSSSALTAFVGTLGAGLTWGGSIFVNPILARVSLSGTRYLCVLGVLLMALGFGLASLSTQVWHLLLTQGLLYGIGSSLLYFPILSTAPEYFTAHRGSAMGFILSGSGIGGLVFSPVIRALLSNIGPRWTLRALAFLVVIISMPIAVTAAPSRFVGRRPTHINLKLAMKPAFLFSVGAGFLQAGGNGLPLTFLSEYSVALGYSAGFGATLLAVSSGVNSVSRVMTGFAGDRFGRQNTLILTVMICVISVLGFWLRSTRNGGSKVLWILFVVFYGIAGGGTERFSLLFALETFASELLLTRKIGYNALFPVVSL